jgi:hypothetical protein
MLNYFPKYFTSKAIFLYVGVLVICNIIFFNRFLPLVWWAFGLVEVLSFFYFSNQLTRKWAAISPKRFVKKLFQTGLIIRVVWVLFSYFFYTAMTGKPFEFETGDAFAYHGSAERIADLIGSGNLQSYFERMKGNYSDMGYPLYVGWQYFFTGKSILIARLFKALYGAFLCVLVYRLATRNFGEAVGRIAGIFCMLMPNLILYSGLHLKEVEMLLLTVAFMERADFMIRSRKFTVINVLVPLVLAATLFFFRTVLGAACLFSLFTALMFSPGRMLKMGKRMILTVWVVVTIIFFVGGNIANEVEEVWQSRTGNQETSLEWRATREGGNKFSTFAGGAVFAPMIFVIPFPTVVETPGQENQKIINGGNYVKNIMAFFVMFAVFWVLKNRKWRDYLLIGSFTIGYLGIIALSPFAQSERFHQPVMPFLMILAAVGISQITNKEKKYFTWYMALMFVAVVGWSWFKLAGRGLA